MFLTFKSVDLLLYSIKIETELVESDNGKFKCFLYFSFSS